MVRLFFWSDLLQRTVFVAPMPWRQTAVIPTMSLCFSALSVWLTDSVADHFLPVRVTIPAPLMSSSGESLTVNTSLVFAVLNSSTSKDTGSCSLLLLPYSPLLVKLGGIPNHFLRCRLVSLSRASTAVLGISYSIIGLISLGNKAF